MKWVLIRHGKTRGNLEGRYIGCRTDEPLCPEGREALLAKAYPPVQRVYASPMRRCLETAALLYPGVPVEIIPDFRECDFGDFENRNYAELNGRADYQAWIDSGGEMPFPGGESRADFAARCRKAFEGIRCQTGDCALIVHGGTVMAIMATYARPQGGYFDFQVKNGGGYILHPDGRYQSI
ncbi:MAG: histidine phosphatase family protein [Clostridiales bacterium]|nr:histidine phosphatase family protein [Clostridiales bacterium]